MELAIANLQLEWQLAEVAQQTIFCEWLSVASMPQEVRLQKGLGGLVCKSKELLRPSDKGSEACSMGQLEVLFVSWRLASCIASPKAEKYVELEPGDSHTSSSINRYDTQMLPEDADLSCRLHLRVNDAKWRQSNKVKVERVIRKVRNQSRSIDKRSAVARSTSFAGGFELIRCSLSNPGNAAAYRPNDLDVAALLACIVAKKSMHAPRRSSIMPFVGSSVCQRVKDSILGRNRALEDALKGRMPFSPLNPVSSVPPPVNHLSEDLPQVAILVQRPRPLAWRAALACVR